MNIDKGLIKHWKMLFEGDESKENGESEVPENENGSSNISESSSTYMNQVIKKMMGANEAVIRSVISGLKIEPGRDKWIPLLKWEEQVKNGNTGEDPTEQDIKNATDAIEILKGIYGYHDSKKEEYFTDY